MTENKDFKRFVRDEAHRSGRRYTEVREQLRPGTSSAMAAPEVAKRFDALVETLDRWIYGQPEATRLVATALVANGNVLLTATAGAGMTMLAKGVAASIGGRLVAIDGREGLLAEEIGRWTARDIVLISHLDGLDRAAQVAVVQAGSTPAIVLAKRHPIAERMPFPPDDETRDRFLFGIRMEQPDVDTELRIVAEARGEGAERPGAVVTLDELGAMRAAANRVHVPDEVRRVAVETVAATRHDPAVVLGATTVATLELVRATAAVAVSEGRDQARVGDVERIVRAVIDHRVVRS